MPPSKSRKNNDFQTYITSVYELQQKIDTLIGYFDGTLTGVDIIRTVRSLKKDAHIIFKTLQDTEPIRRQCFSRDGKRKRNSVEQFEHEEEMSATYALLGLNNSDNKPQKVRKTDDLIFDALSTTTGKKRQFAKQVMSLSDYKTIYDEVTGRGGLEAVSKKKEWKAIAKCIRSDELLRGQTSAGNEVKRIFMQTESILRTFA
jgi:hypothetical protein